MTMAAVNLDYCPGKRAHWAGLLALAIGAAGLASALWCYRDLGRELAHSEALLAKLQDRDKSESMPVVVGARDSEQIARETKQANAAILELSLPWKELFGAFEASQTNAVAVLAIEPDVQKGLVHISAEAKKLESMLAYVASLQKIALFREVLILNHQIQDQDPEKPVRFVLQAAWGTPR